MMAKQAQIAKPELFNSNPLIKFMSRDESWTVSSDEKQPLDMRNYLANGTLGFAKINDDWNPMVSLTELNKHPQFTYTNRAYRMHASKNQIICIDIENTADDKTKEFLLQFPFEYLEYSKHGGIHGLMHVDKKLLSPTMLAIFQVATTIRHPSKTWEMFLNKHYCTFTQNVIQPRQFTAEQKATKTKEFLDYVVKMYQQKESTHAQQVDSVKLKKEVPDYIEQIAQIFPKSDFEYIAQLTPEDYRSDSGLIDMSKYEYNVLLFIRKQLTNRILYGFDDPFYALNLPKPIEKLTTEDYVYLTFYFGQKILPHRDKHDTERNGVPFLLYIASAVGNLSQSQFQSVKKSAKYGPLVLDKTGFNKFFRS